MHRVYGIGFSYTYTRMCNNINNNCIYIGGRCPRGVKKI